MSKTILINGFGRMGRLALRSLMDRPELRHWLSPVGLNDNAMTPMQAAHLLEFDSVHGRWSCPVSYDDAHLRIDGMSLPLTSFAEKDQIPLSDIDIVLDCTGVGRETGRLIPYLENGARKVIVSAPLKDFRGEEGTEATERGLNIVMGVNHDRYDPARHHILTAASCTTNCLAPVVKVVHEHLGIRHGVITTIHDVTNTQMMVDGAHKDLRRARSGLLSLIPTSTGSATAITTIYPELKGRLNGLAVRVPLLNASLTDCVFEVEQDTTAEEVNALFKQAAQTTLKDILGVEERPLVSVDFLNDPRSAIIDAPSTMVVDRRQVKILAWYDNEWGYVNRMMELAALVARQL
ncbi:ArsJ-associated glyceraldehyde-3-phosphate dehydrogenase [Luteithermobacter gelatinilyticus]|uniref:ArsJ-associated glyceraldehyde-3-phosphate dehydrogenase n=1 Tax=Luteithermobacter gelatinilyticus TaxID=2582913 RepID=UPI001105F0ED|nr:ArsJ-associated glyceraldehyde-3-phosphate dehydrogenase [Luteithermobacter gelatinilyticus]|tara:strand:- start:7974 stop:9020 length:1047 start_codon:yes stop_codon:yes gene_type:complete